MNAFRTLESAVKNSPKQIGQILKDEEEALLLEEDQGEIVAATTEIVPVQVAMDSGAVDNVVNPDDLPSSVTPSGNPSGRHFVGAHGSEIKKYGCGNTLCKGGQGDYGCKWQVADVTRPRRSVSKVTGSP